MAASLQQLREALRVRFEGDALLGARFLPIVPGRTPAPSMAGTAVAAPPPRAVDADEIQRRRAILERLDTEQVKPCRKCGLAATRLKTVFGQGSAAARIAFVGEAPGADEDRSGLAFVGKAGKLLTDMIEKGMGLKRDDVYICNVIKCRPPDNRTPAGDETAACAPYLWEQLRTIQPEIVIALGAPAAQTLLGTREGIGRLRGRFHDCYLSGSPMIGEPTPLMPTFHPAYLLRSPGEKGKAWDDLKLVMARLGIPMPGRAR